MASLPKACGRRELSKRPYRTYTRRRFGALYAESVPEENAEFFNKFMGTSVTSYADVEGVSRVGDTPWKELVERQVNALRFGSVLITVHEGRVVQVETSVKVRFDKP